MLPTSSSTLAITACTNCNSAAVASYPTDGILEYSGLFSTPNHHSSSRAVEITISGFVNGDEARMYTFAVWTLFKDGTTYYNINQAPITFELRSEPPLLVTSSSAVLGDADGVTHSINHRIVNNFKPAEHWLQLTIPAVNHDYSTVAGATAVHLPGDV